MNVWSLIREPDDEIAEVRISLGKPRGFDGAYLVFRGNPIDVCDLLKAAYEEATSKLLGGDYDDKRGRPQG